MDKINQLDITDYNIGDFYSMTIEQLRDVAQFLNVSSPTKKAKKELVQLVYQAKSGTLPDDNYVAKTGRGRPSGPAKGNYYVDWRRIHGENKRADAETNSLGENKSSAFNQNGRQEGQKADAQAGDEYEGALDILVDGYGFVRVNKYDPSTGDVYINAKVIRRYDLRRGDIIKCIAKRQYEDKPPAVTSVLAINGVSPEQGVKRPDFDDLVPIYPDKKFMLSAGAKSDLSARCIDLVCPIGRGQRALVVAPPKAGKTTIIKSIAKSLNSNYPDIKLYVLLVGERPEEVTDMRRSVQGEVVASTFDDSSDRHVRVSEMVIERAKRDVESGQDVVIIMDSLNRLTRAYNDVVESSGRTLSGGIDPQALYPAKKFFGAARNIENGGSLTIITTTLVETGSRMDDVIYEEFKGTGNMELHLSRRLSEFKIFPAIDLAKSGTRRDELLLTTKEMEASYVLHRMINASEADGTREFLRMVLATKNNAELCDQLILYSRKIDK